MSNSLVAVLMVILSSLLGATGGYFFKVGAQSLSFKVSKLITNFPLIGGFILFASSSFVYLFALRISKLTILYPLSSLSYVWSLFIGLYFLNEKITLLKGIGVVFILGGASLVVLSI